MTKQAIHVLLVDDEEKLLKSIARRLEVLGIVPFTATNGMQAIDIASKNTIDLAIVDLQMPDMDGLVTITKLKEIKPNLKTILLTGHGNDKVKQATESLNTLYFEKDEMGDFWHFIKKLNSDGKVIVIRPTASPAGREVPTGFSQKNDIEIHSHPDIIETDYRKRTFGKETHHSSSFTHLRIVGEAPAMRKLRKSITRMASLDCTITLRGEPGTGKELAARAIHAGSMRNHYRFLAINCADFGREQLAGQLLGYKDGNLVEAIRTRSGIFSAGEVGTLLFDQIEEMPANMQDQLLDILEAIDSQQPDSPMDIRILAATATDLGKRVREKSFGKSLYERLTVFELMMPPLRERKDDIQPLCQYFFDKYRRELGKPVELVSPDVLQTLVEYNFPGNVGELEHIIERAVIIADGKIISLEHLPQRFREHPKSDGPLETKQFSTLAELENRYILEVLEATNGNKSKTSEILGISRAALWRKLKLLTSEKNNP